MCLLAHYIVNRGVMPLRRNAWQTTVPIPVQDLAPSIFVSDADAEASLQRQIAVAGVDELLRLAEGFKQRTAEINAEVNLLIELDAPWQGEWPGVLAAL